MKSAVAVISVFVVASLAFAELPTPPRWPPPGVTPKLRPGVAGPVAPPPAGEKSNAGLLGASPESEAGKILDRLQSNLRDVAKRLEVKDASDDTRKLQQEILDDLDRLLKPPPQDQPPMPLDQSNPPPMPMEQGGQSQPMGGSSAQQRPMGGQGQSMPQPMGGQSPQPNGGSQQRPMGGQGQQPQPQGMSRQEQRQMRELAKQDQKAQAQSGAEQLAGAPQLPGGQAGDPKGPAKPPPRIVFDPDQALKEAWGKLPEQERQALDQFYKERFMPRYQELLKQYYSTTAERNGKKP